MVSLDRRRRGGISTKMLANISAKLADAILAEAKRRAPVCTGALRASGVRTPRGRAKAYKVEFTVPYAEEVHNGRPANPGYTETYRVRGYSIPMEYETDITVYPTNRRYKVSSYKKRISKTRKSIATYTRTRQGKKRVRVPCKTSGSKWVTLDLTKATDPNPFLENAAQTVLANAGIKKALKGLR